MPITTDNTHKESKHLKLWIHSSWNPNIALEDVDYWFDDLAPSQELQIKFESVEQTSSNKQLLINLYQEELSAPEKDFLISVIRSDIQQGKHYTFVCCCDEHHFCHHKALNEIISKESLND